MRSEKRRARLRPSTIQKLTSIKEAILANPYLYNQNAACTAGVSCGSAGCLFGHAVAMFGEKEETVLGISGVVRIYVNGAQLLGLTYRRTIRANTALNDHATQAGKLFNAGAWPREFQIKLATENAAQAAAARIDHFIATDGAE